MEVSQTKSIHPYNELPENVNLVFPENLIPGKKYVIYMSNICPFYYNGKKNRKFIGTFIKNENLKNLYEIKSYFNEVYNILTKNTYRTDSFINSNKSKNKQKYYFFEKRELPSLEDELNIRKKNKYMIKELFRSLKFRKEILGKEMHFLGSINFDIIEDVNI
jgi:hypothetical protein